MSENVLGKSPALSISVTFSPAHLFLNLSHRSSLLPPSRVFPLVQTTAVVQSLQSGRSSFYKLFPVFFSKHLFLSSACTNASKKQAAAEFRTSAQITGRNVCRSQHSILYIIVVHFVAPPLCLISPAFVTFSLSFYHSILLQHLLFIFLTRFIPVAVLLCACKTCPPAALLRVFKFLCKDKFVLSSFTKPFRLLEKLPSGF